MKNCKIFNIVYRLTRIIWKDKPKKVIVLYGYSDIRITLLPSNMEHEEFCVNL